MKKISIVIFIVLIAMVACKTKVGNEAKKNTAKSIELTINFATKSNSGVTGTANFVEENGKVSFNAVLSGLKPGVHAIHIHEKADCSSDDASSAGGHWNPTFQNHGKWGSTAYHKGDIGNFSADENGNGTISLTTDEWCIGCGDANKDITGKGLIVHDERDDYTSQPAGNAGARVACSAIIQ